jgi:hypothetical protein
MSGRPDINVPPTITTNPAGNPKLLCETAYCRAERDHVGLHDIRPCLPTCGLLRPGLGRVHDAGCPNADWTLR